MTKPVYRARDLWVLCACVECGHLNYVEPHGTTAECAKCHRSTEHTSRLPTAKHVPPNLDKPHRCPQCHKIPDEAQTDGKALPGKRYTCTSCIVYWTAPKA